MQQGGIHLHVAAGVAALAVWLLAGAAAHAAPADLDPSFGDGGYAVHDMGGDEAADAIVVQEGGKVVLVGGPGRSGDGTAAIRLNEDGSVDPSFGTDGMATVDLACWSCFAAPQPGGEIVIAGTEFADRGSRFAVARIDSDGGRDGSFGSDGKAVIDLAAGDYDRLDDLAIQPDGNIVLSGTTGGDFAVVRLTADGVLDSRFSGNGKRRVDSGAEEYAAVAAIQADGKLLIGGPAADPEPSGEDRFVVARLHADGSGDPSFGSAGIAVVDNLPAGGWGGAVAGLAVQADGRILVAGNPGFDLALARLNADGSPDSGFGSDGRATLDAGRYEFVRGVAVQSDGRIVVAGESGQTGGLGGVWDGDFAVGRFSGDGIPDPTFGEDGIVTYSLVEDDYARALALQEDGKILIAGRTNGPNYDIGDAEPVPADIAVIRLMGDADVTPPDTRIDSGPAGTTSSTDAELAFSATPAWDVDRFQCNLDGAGWQPCASPKAYSGLAPGSHTFRVRAVDAAGNVDPTPASRSWTVEAGPSQGCLDAKDALAVAKAKLVPAKKHALKAKRRVLAWKKRADAATTKREMRRAKRALRHSWLVFKRSVRRYRQARSGYRRALRGARKECPSRRGATQ